MTTRAKKPPAEALAEAPQAERPTSLTPGVLADLRRPFTAAAVKFKPQAVSKSSDKALATFYIDARLAAERLNYVVGAENWSNAPRVLFEADPQAHAAFYFPVEQALTVFGVTKVDVGVYTNGNKPDDKASKSSYSDSLKRAAVMFGIGAYLYALPKQWFDYDRERKQWKNEAAIRRAYEQAVAKLGIGDPIDHGDLVDHETEPVEEATPPPAAADAPDPAAGVKRDGRIHVTDKAQIVAMVNLAYEAGFTPEEVQKVLDNERQATGGHYRKKWLTEQLQELNAAIAEKAAA